MKQRNRQIFWRGALLALGATLVWSPPMVSQAQTSVTAPSNAERQDLASVRDAASAFEAGRLAEARALAGARDDSASLIVRARFAHWSGDDAGALQMSEQ